MGDDQNQSCFYGGTLCTNMILAPRTAILSCHQYRRETIVGVMAAPMIRSCTPQNMALTISSYARLIHLALSAAFVVSCPTEDTSLPAPATVLHAANSISTVPTTVIWILDFMRMFLTGRPGKGVLRHLKTWRARLFRRQGPKTVAAGII